MGVARILVGVVNDAAKLSYCFVLILVLTTLAYADTNERSWEIYGNCMVHTSVDDFTDKISHGLHCSDAITRLVEEDKHSGSMANVARLLVERSAAIIFLWDKGKSLTAILKTGHWTSHRDSRILVTTRIDKGTVWDGKWEWMPELMAAMTWNKVIVNRLLDELPNKKRMVFRIGDERASILLNGSAEAIKDFRSRIAGMGEDG